MKRGALQQLGQVALQAVRVIKVAVPLSVVVRQFFLEQGAVPVVGGVGSHVERIAAARAIVAHRIAAARATVANSENRPRSVE